MASLLSLDPTPAPPSVSARVLAHGTAVVTLTALAATPAVFGPVYAQVAMGAGLVVGSHLAAAGKMRAAGDVAAALVGPAVMFAGLTSLGHLQPLTMTAAVIQGAGLGVSFLAVLKAAAIYRATRQGVLQALAEPVLERLKRRRLGGPPTPAPDAAGEQHDTNRPSRRLRP